MRRYALAGRTVALTGSTGGLGSALAEALRTRGVDELTAEVAARTAVMVFGIAFGQWVADGERRSFGEIAAGVLDELPVVTGALARGRR